MPKIVRWLGCAALVLCVSVERAGAQDEGDFVVQLGQDTTSVEHWVRTPARLEVDQVGRSPRVQRRHFIYDFANGSLSRFTMVVTPPGATAPTQTVEAIVAVDSLHIVTQNAGAAPQKRAVAAQPGFTVLPSASPWVGSESATRRLFAEKQDSLRVPVWFLGAPGTSWMTVRRTGRDAVSLVNERGTYALHVDEAGRIRDVKPISGTALFAVQRVAKLDLDALATAYMAREKAGAGLGVLSPRDTVKVADAGGAMLTIDYGRPAKRGRTIFGGVVSFGEVWRTGANAATQFRTDKALVFGGTVVPAGFYTLWTVPTAQSWKLLVNGETGQWGTEHKPEKDLFTIDMQVTALPAPVERFTIHVEPAPQGGLLQLDWDTTRASAPFVVQR